MLHDICVYALIVRSWPVSSRVDLTLDTALENRISSLTLVRSDRHQSVCAGFSAVLLVLLFLFQTTVARGQPPGFSHQDRIKVVILFSYQQGSWVAENEDRGILEGLSNSGYTEDANLVITRLYMNTNTVNKGSRQKEAAAMDLVRRIEGIGPDILLIMDDDALRHVGAKLLDTPLPIAFGGINLPVTDVDYGWGTDRQRTALADSMEYPGHNLTGVLERVAVVSGINLLHQILPDAKSVLFLSDNSLLSRQLLRTTDVKEGLRDLPIRIEKQLLTDSYEQMQQTVLDYQNRVDCIVMFLPWSFEENSGRHVPQKQVAGWLLENNNLPGLVYLDVLAEEGFLCAVAVDMHQLGVHTGSIAGRILDGGRPEAMPIVDPVANRIMINLARAGQLDIDIPFEVLKNADVLLNTMTAYPQQDD
jgi:putative tryptophan/tyrosine transport system substrate-binding protein